MRLPLWWPLLSEVLLQQQSHHSKNVMLENNIHRILLGLMFECYQPVQIPFWFGWSTVLFAKKILQAKNSSTIFK